MHILFSFFSGIGVPIGVPIGVVVKEVEDYYKGKLNKFPVRSEKMTSLYKVCCCTGRGVRNT